MSNEDGRKMQKLFFPYYVNQGRLLDIYAILNGGYSEYSEITTAIGSEKQKGSEAGASASHGFKLINFGANISIDSMQSNSINNENKEKKIQTVTSVLSIVKDTLQERGYLVDIQKSKPGDFVCIPVKLVVNSVKSLLSEMSELLKLSGMMKGLQQKGVEKEKGLPEVEKALRTIRVLFGGEEILYMRDEYAIIGNIVDSNLYQAERADIIGTNLMCLAQVKRVFPQGTELMKNTTFSKIKDAAAKRNAIEAIQKFVQGNVFEFEAVAVTEVNDRPVYQLEIIALYQ